MLETICQKSRKARKQHTCNYCGNKIEVGQVYNHAVMKFDDVYTWKAHLECIQIATELWGFIDPLEGMTEDDFQYGCNDFCRTFICPDCECWDKEADECEKDETFCADKIYAFLQTHDFRHTKHGIWKCFPKEQMDGDSHEA